MMVDFNCKTDMITNPNLPNSNNAPVDFCNKLQVPSPAPPFRSAGELSPASESACAAYEVYLRLPELRRFWTAVEFPGWNNEPIVKPALQALEITFRFISIVLNDPRPYSNRREWSRRLEALARDQVEIIAQLCEEEAENGETATAPIIDLSSSSGVLSRDASSSAEVWRLSGDSTIVSRASEASLLPRLATWQRSEPIATTVLYSIECAMRRCPYNLGLGEPNLTGKPSLNYDAVCRPSELHALKPSQIAADNHENHHLFAIHQIFESWIYVSSRLLDRAESKIESKEFESAAIGCWLLERIWKLLEQIERLHLLMDPDDFLRVTKQLRVKTGSDSESFCFRSRGLVSITKRSKDIRHKVPAVLGVAVDPMGGPVIQEAAMRLYREKGSFEKIHLFQAMQAVESAVKGFFYGYKQLLVTAMGSVEAQGNRAVALAAAEDALAQIFLEPTYYPSLDAAKTFLGGFWEQEVNGAAADRRIWDRR